MPNRKSNCLLAALLCAACLSVHAEQADRAKPIQVEADSFTGDEKNRTSTYAGNVIVTQGTMVMRADRAVIKQDAEGNYFASANGRPLTYREKQDNSDDYIEGQAERMEYNGKIGQLQLFTKARLKRGVDEVRGDYIFYDQKAGNFKVGPSAETSAGSPGRVRMTIQPKATDAAPPAAGQAPVLKPSPGVTKPREE